MNDSNADKIREWIADANLLLPNNIDEWVFQRSHNRALAALEIAVDGLEPLTRRKPVKPDYHSTCHQCEDDATEAAGKLAEILKKLEE